MFSETCFGFWEPSASVNTWLKLDAKRAGGGDVYLLGVVKLERSGGIAQCDCISLVS